MLTLLQHYSYLPDFSTAICEENKIVIAENR